MSTSTVKAVKSQLVTQIKAQTACADPVLVTYDEPSMYQADDIVSVGTVDRQIAPATLAGGMAVQGSVTEDYLVSVMVDCFRGGDQAQTVSEQMLTLVDAVETAVRADITLGGNVILAWPHAARYEGAQEDAHKGRRAHGELQILVKAQI